LLLITIIGALNMNTTKSYSHVEILSFSVIFFRDELSEDCFKAEILNFEEDDMILYNSKDDSFEVQIYPNADYIDDVEEFVNILKAELKLFALDILSGANRYNEHRFVLTYEMDDDVTECSLVLLDDGENTDDYAFDGNFMTIYKDGALEFDIKLKNEYDFIELFNILKQYAETQFN
jgi:hypothetical protein